MDQQEFERYKSFYYLIGSPSLAGDALACFVAGPGLRDADAARSAVYFFSRLAELHPVVLRQYEAVARDTSSEGKAFVLKIFEHVADEGTRRFLTLARGDHAFAAQRDQIARLLEATTQTKVDILHSDIRDVGDLDLLWTEFSVSASKVAVRRIIQVLEWPDRIRTRLEEWLRAKPTSGFFLFKPDPSRRKQIVDSLAKVAGIVCDLDRAEIANREDLDFLCFLDQLQKRGPDHLEKIRRTLPFSLTVEDLRHITIRSVAASSLLEYARQHDLVREACEEDLPILSHRARLTLLEILGRAYLDIEEFSNARARLEEYCQVNPAERKVREKLRLAQAEERLEKLSQISLEAESIDLVEVLDGEPDARRCVLATQRATSYRSWLTIRDFSRTTLGALDYVIARWRLTYVSPDRFHVSQVIPWFWQESPEDGDVDEWITIGTKHYQRVDGWFQVPGSPQMKLNSFLTVDKYLTLMRYAEPTVVGAIEDADGRSLLFEFEFPKLGDFFSFDEIQHWYLLRDRSEPALAAHAVPPDGEALSYHHLRDRWAVLRVLVDPDTARLSKAYLVIGGPEPQIGMPQLIVEQGFASYDDGFHIEVPRLAK